MNDGGLGADCKWVIGGMSAAILGLCGAVAYCAKGWLNAVLSQVKQRDETIAQLNAARTAALRKKGESP